LVQPLPFLRDPARLVAPPTLVRPPRLSAARSLWKDVMSLPGSDIFALVSSVLDEQRAHRALAGRWLAFCRE
jgi:hypothetical protein